MRDIHVSIGDHTLERGSVLQDDRVRGRIYGVDPVGVKAVPTLVVMGGISATRFVADDGRGGPGWWTRMVRDGGPIDTQKFRVIGYDFAPNINNPARPDCITTGDQAERLKALLDSQGITRVDGIIGSSYGGMTALAFAQNYPGSAGKLCIIGAAHRPYPIGVGWRGIQRRIVRLAIDAGRPEEGLKLARQLAMTTYRTPEEFADRFDISETAPCPDKTISGAEFDICSYLSNRGEAFANDMDAERFLALSESIDLHRVEPEKIAAPTLLISAISDQLAPLPDMRELRDRLAGPAELYAITSLFGHDAFLKEYDQIGPAVARFCEGV